MAAAPGSGASLARWLGVLVASGVLVILLAWQRRQVASPGAALPDVPASGAAAGTAGALPPAEPPRALPDRGLRTPPEEALGAIDPRAVWRDQVARVVRPLVAERLGRAPTTSEEERLVDALASVGPAARTLDREVLDPDDPRSIARVREQTRVLIEADQTVRAMLGIGIAELLRRLDPSRIDDRGGDAAG